MKVRLLAVLVLGGLAHVHASVDRTSMLVDLMRVDSEFNALTQRVGRIEGFLANMADDALLVNRATRGKTEARESFQRTDPKGLRLIWGATYADVSAAGDLGYTLGPWQREVPDKEAGAVQQSTGMFLTIWQRQPDGSWKFVIDGIGSGMNPDQLERVHRSIRGYPAPSAYPPANRSDRRDVIDALRGLDRGTSGESSAFLAHVADDAALLDLAMHSKAAATDPLMQGTKGLTFSRELIHATVAESQDLAYTWGALTVTRRDLADSPPTRTAIYLHVWKRQPDGAWKIVVSGSSGQTPETIARLRAPVEKESD